MPLNKGGSTMTTAESTKRRRSLDNQATVAVKRPSHHRGPTHHDAVTIENARALNPVHIRPEELKVHIQEAVDNALSPQPRKYSSVRCLLVSWAADDLGCIDEITQLQRLFEDGYGFQSEAFQIPSEDSERQLRLKLNDFDRTMKETDLFIIYYGGHADNPRPYDDFIWTANETSTAPILNWSDLQSIVEQMPPDVLMILDCCYAAHIARGTIPGKKEVLAASGWEVRAVGGVQSKSSFTAFLIHDLKHFAQRARPFTVSELYTHMVSNRNGPDGQRLKRTPFYCQLNCRDTRRQIVLSPPLKPKSSSLSDQASELSRSSITAYPRMVVAVSFFSGFEHDTAERVRQWLTNAIPTEVQGICIDVEMVARSNSTLTILSMPIALWMSLSANPALRPCGIIVGPPDSTPAQGPIPAMVASERRKVDLTRDSTIADFFREDVGPGPNYPDPLSRETSLLASLESRARPLLDPAGQRFNTVLDRPWTDHERVQLCEEMIKSCSVDWRDLVRIIQKSRNTPPSLQNVALPPGRSLASCRSMYEQMIVSATGPQRIKSVPYLEPLSRTPSSMLSAPTAKRKRGRPTKAEVQARATAAVEAKPSPLPVPPPSGSSSQARDRHNSRIEPAAGAPKTTRKRGRPTKADAKVTTATNESSASPARAPSTGSSQYSEVFNPPFFDTPSP